jgi:uncharacterized protein
MSETVKPIPTLDMIQAHRDAILAIAARYGAYDVRVFGSVARGEATADSDVDFVVKFQSWVSLYEIAGLTHELQAMLGVVVDVIEDHDRLRENFRKRASAEWIAL